MSLQDGPHYALENRRSGRAQRNPTTDGKSLSESSPEKQKEIQMPTGINKNFAERFRIYTAR